MRSSSLFFEAQYSQKKFGFRNSGSSFTDIVDSPFLAHGFAGIPANRHYNAPYFDNSDPENRDNKQITAALSYFLSTSSFGRHDLKFGFENYQSTRTGGNSQSSTDYVFIVDPVVSGGAPVISNGRIVPNFVPGQSVLQQWLPVRGAQVDLTTRSFYVNDRWTLNDRWSFNIGLRFENVTSDATQVQSVRYSGVLAAASRWRSRIARGAGPDDEPSKKRRARYRPWAELLARTFGVDALACPACQGRMRLVALVRNPLSIRLAPRQDRRTHRTARTLARPWPTVLGLHHPPPQGPRLRGALSGGSPWRT